MYRHLVTILFFFTASVLLAQSEKGLVAKYSFDKGDARDDIGKNNARSAAVSFVKDRFGNDASACYLQGYYGSYLNLGTSKTLKPLNGTISLWFYIDNVVESGEGVKFNPILLTKNDTCNDFYEGYYIGYNMGSDRLNTTISQSKKLQAMIRSAENINTLKWYHVAITFDSTTLCLYVNGKLDCSLAKNFTNRYLATDSVMVGNSANRKNFRFFNGSVDDILIYNRVLSAEEINELYNAKDPKAYNLYIKWVGIILAISLVIIGMSMFIWNRVYKARLEKEKSINLVNARLNDLETKAIRTQMNPHFIFNSLNTLQRFILEDDNRTAHLYLTKFSKLLRRLLESSVADSISLVEEMEILNGYVEIEQLRSDNAFEFEIRSDVKDAEKINIPFMLVQPFVENAIWHGLMPKKEDRCLSVSFSLLDKKRVLCIVDDNGVGREQSSQHKDPLKKKSLAIEFIKQRLELLQKSSGIECSVEIIDKKENNINLGTQIKIIIPILN